MMRKEFEKFRKLIEPIRDKIINVYHETELTTKEKVIKIVDIMKGSNDSKYIKYVRADLDEDNFILIYPDGKVEYYKIELNDNGIPVDKLLKTFDSPNDITNYRRKMRTLIIEWDYSSL